MKSNISKFKLQKSWLGKSKILKSVIWFWFYAQLKKDKFFWDTRYQAIPGNDQIAYPTNQKAAGSKLKRTS